MSFTVTVQPAGRVFEAQRDETLLAAAMKAQVGLPYGCKDGACGSCKCKLVEGRVIHTAHQAKALSEAEEAAGFVLTCCATPQTDVVLESHQVTGEGQFPIKKLPCRVMEIHRPAADVAILKVQLPANDNFQYHAGQYVEFLLRDGSRRAYSMASAPSNLGEPPKIELHIRHMPGGKFTDHVFGAMKEKDILRLEGPFGSFYLREDSEAPIILLASGTGFAPIKALIEHMEHKGIANRPASLYWGGRTKADLYALEWLEAAAARLPWLTVVPVLSDAKPEDHWTGRTGFVHLAVLADFADLSQHEVYACGAPIVIESAKRDFSAQAGLPEARFHADSFTSEADKAAD
jgi:CDP-4-dehydro-6-deoxyglucose reductase